MFTSQTDLIFPVDSVPEAAPLPPDAERLEIDSDDGQRLHGVYFPPRTDGQGDGTLILGFGGNGWNGQDVASYLHEVFPANPVIVFHYRGYRPSKGRPSSEALIADAPLVYDAAVARARPERTVAVGFSIGSGIAATLAGRRDIDGVVLVTPFDSLKAVAQSMVPWLPIGPLFAHEIDTVAALEGTRVPVAVIGAERDEIVPPERTAALRRKLGRLAYDRTIERAGHNDVYARSDFQQALRDALEAVLGEG